MKRGEDVIDVVGCEVAAVGVEFVKGGGDFGREDNGRQVQGLVVGKRGNVGVAFVSVRMGGEAKRGRS